MLAETSALFTRGGRDTARLAANQGCSQRVIDFASQLKLAFPLCLVANIAAPLDSSTGRRKNLNL